MHGQYKSTLFCPKCKNYSYTFDPFNSLSLPIPIGNYKEFRFYFIHAANQFPSSILCDFDLNNNLGYLRLKTSEMLNIDPKGFIFITVVNDVVKEYLRDEIKLLNIKNVTLFAYELQSDVDRDLFEVQITQEKPRKHRQKSDHIAYPRIISMLKSATFKHIHREVFKKIRMSFNNYKNRNMNLKQSYEDHLNDPAYDLYLLVQRNEKCALCNSQTCLGCRIPYSDQLYSEFIDKEVIFELRLKTNCQELGVKIEDLNKCIEFKTTNEPRNTARNINLHECFQSFGIPEELEKENAWYCPSCKNHVLATKQLEIYKVPEILIIHLKRFRTNGYQREKVSVPVIFPESELDISSYVIGSQKTMLYDLYAVSNHFGSLGGGHYTATCFSNHQNKWLEFNDSQVTGPADLSNTSSYLLFYKARRPQ